jgi:hypothetical protein
MGLNIYNVNKCLVMRYADLTYLVKKNTQCTVYGPYMILRLKYRERKDILAHCAC